VARGSPVGSLVLGQGSETGKVVYAILNGIAACSRPRELLAWFYREQEDGKDVTLDELVVVEKAPWLEKVGEYACWPG